MNPSPETELVAPNAFCLLVSVVLSAQTTDKAVNKATEPLYKVAYTPELMLALGEEKIKGFIKSIGLYKNKAKVGRKTANVILNVVYHKPTMPVDTHLLRICPKIGLAQGSTPLEVERSLLERIPSEFMMHAHHWLILHGRYICTARNPKCAECPINDLCLHNENFTK